MVHLTLHLLTGTVARPSQVTGAVPTPTTIFAAIIAPTYITVYVPLIQVAANPTARRVSTPTAGIVAATVPATVITTAAVPLRIPAVLSGVCCHCEP